LSVRFYYGSGSPYAWRVWLALEHKGIPYHRKTLSFDAGDLKTAEFGALNPRRRVPVLVDDDFPLAESAAIVEYIEARWPSGPALVAIRASARSSGAWCAKPMTIWPTSASVGRGRGGRARRSAARACLWEDAGTGEYLTGELSAVDLTVYPLLALFPRLAGRRADFVKGDVIGPRLSVWIACRGFPLLSGPGRLIGNERLDSVRLSAVARGRPAGVGHRR
jgi:glutathione S-transferase